MAGAYIEIDDAAVLAALDRLIAAGERPRPALSEIGESLLQSTRKRFSDQVSPDGQPWAPLSPAYAKRKAKKGGRSRDLILVLNGYLAELNAYQLGDDEVAIGTNRIYGAVHQFGWPERNIPARPFLGVSEGDRTEILEILNEHLAAAAG